MFRLSIRLATLSVAVFTVLAAGSAAQASSSLYLGGPWWQNASAPSYTFGADGITLTVTATQDSGQDEGYAEVHQNMLGLGVNWGEDMNISEGKTLWLEFSETVMLTGAWFTYAGYGDEVRFVDDQGEILGDIALWPSLFGFKFINLDGTLDLVGTTFGLTATDSQDDFRLKHLYFTPYDASTFDLGNVTPVPVPAAAWPALALMLGLVAVHRFRRQSA